MNVSIRNNKGFSLVELMVVVAIIGILAAIAVPNFQRFTAKSKQSEARANLSAVFSAEQAFTSEWNTYWTDFRSLGYGPVGQLRYRHGWSAAGGITLPANYPGGATSGNPSVDFNTTVYCGVAANNCTEITVPIAPSGITNSAIAATSFTAEANGDIDGDATIDTWTVNEKKVFANLIDDVNN